MAHKQNFGIMVPTYSKNMMEMELPGKRKRGRPKRRFLDVVKEDMAEVGAKETNVKNRTV